MRVTLLPRDAAARVTTTAVATLAWAAGATIIVSTIPALSETLVRIDRVDTIPMAAGLLLLILVALLLAMWNMTPRAVIGFLLIAGTLTVSYQVTLYEAGLAESLESAFLLNRPMLVLVTVGVAAPTACAGIAWGAVGYAVAWAGTFTAAAIAQVPVVAGWGPTLTLGVATVLHLTLVAIQNRQRRRFPRFDELEAATKRRAASADLARRTTAMVHDTVLNDLAYVMNAPDELDARAREQLVTDIATLEGGDWMRVTESVPTAEAEQVRVRNEFVRLASDFRWRGLTVNVTGAGRGVLAYPPGTSDALLGAVRASLENVLKHAGTDSADVEIVYSENELTFMISDQGDGFDMTQFDPNRLGVRGSIIGRIEAVGGRARIWSSPGAGTTVMISIPIHTVDAGDPPDHQERHHDE